MKPFPRVALVGLALTAAVNVVFAQAPKSSSPTTMSVVRRVGCGCCLKWVEQMEKAGYKATVTESPEIEALKDEKGVPKAARSCHTAVIDGYVIEGHVPVADVKRLLQTRPKVAGLAVPGMPQGSPGMEVASGVTEAFDVLAFDKAGKTSVFASHR